MVRRRIGTLVIVASLVAAGACTPKSRTSSPEPGRTTSAPPVAPATWHVVAPAPMAPTNMLWDVVATDATHAWAVGAEGYSPLKPDTSGRPVIQRWDGTRWSREPLPGITWVGALRHVAAASANDVWAVGDQSNADPDKVAPKMLRYDGRAWRSVPAPVRKGPTHLMTDFAAADGHAWYVGNVGTRPAFEEWTGSGWVTRQPPEECLRVDPTGGVLTFCMVSSVTAFAANDVWATGNGSWPGFKGPLLFHWDGRVWRTVQLGMNGAEFFLTDIAGRSSTELWAVGNQFNSAKPFVVRGNGSKWAIVDDPPAGLLAGVTLDAGGKPWIIENMTPLGTTLTTSGSREAWTGTPAPMPQQAIGLRLETITTVPGTATMFAVGMIDLPTDPGTVEAVILEYSPEPDEADPDQRV